MLDRSASPVCIIQLAEGLLKITKKWTVALRSTSSFAREYGNPVNLLDNQEKYQNLSVLSLSKM
jgi:hypothetical protein